MSEPIARRKALIDYRISTTKCKKCGKIYFPPKSFCDKEGRESEMSHIDYLYKKGKLYSGAVINVPTNKFKHLGTHISAIVHFPDDDFKIPGRITDYLVPEEENILKFIDKDLVSRFRRTYSDGEKGLVYYSSLNFSFEDDYYPFQNYAVQKASAMNYKPGIVGYGVYLPKYRIKNDGSGILGVKERTVPFPDEDSTTFAVEAGKRALIHSGVANSLIKKCFVGTESPTYAVKPIMSTVSQALELGEKYEDGFFVGGIDSQFACKAATDLFVDAAALVAYPVFGGDYIMVTGTDNSQAAPGDPLDYTVGAGAVSFIFGRKDVIATLEHHVSYTSDTSDFYRRKRDKYPRHGGRFTGEPAYFKHVLTSMKTILKKSKLAPSDINFVVAHSPNRVFPYKASLEVGFDKEQIFPGLVVTHIGNLYSGSCLAALASVLDIAEPKDKILMTSYGSGAGSDSYIFEVTEKILEKKDRIITVKEQIENPHRKYVDYNTYRKWKEIS